MYIVKETITCATLFSWGKLGIVVGKELLYIKNSNLYIKDYKSKLAVR